MDYIFLAISFIVVFFRLELSNRPPQWIPLSIMACQLCLLAFIVAALPSLLSARAFNSGTSKLERDVDHIAEEYDYIIAGGGTSGLVVANRLTEDPDSRCLFLFTEGRHLSQVFGPLRIMC